MNSDVGALPPAGWHPDPEDPAQLRYWDGSAWTDHRAPAVAAAPTDYSTSAAPTAPIAAAQPSEPSATADPYLRPDPSLSAPPTSLAEPQAIQPPGPTVPLAPSQSLADSPGKGGIPWWVWVLIALIPVLLTAIVVVVIVALLRYDEEPSASAPPPAAVEQTQLPEDTEPVDDDTTSAPDDAPDPAVGGDGTFGEGVWLVGEDVAPGTYRLTAPIDSGSTLAWCYWAVSTDDSGDLDALIVNGIPDGGIPTVTLQSGEVVETYECGTWAQADPAALFANDAAATTFSDGVWLVGEDIAPGTYRTDDEIEAEDFLDACYWERSTGIERNFMDLVDVDIVETGRPTVTLEVGEQFTSMECGNWSAAS